MKINGAWYTDEMPNHVVVELENGSLAKFYLTPFREITEADLTPYHSTKRAGQTLPPYLYRHYGLELAGDIPQEDRAEITVAEAVALAESMGQSITDRTIRLAADNGYIPGARKVGRDWLLPRYGLVHYLENRPRPGRNRGG